MLAKSDSTSPAGAGLRLSRLSTDRGISEHLIPADAADGPYVDPLLQFPLGHLQGTLRLIERSGPGRHSIPHELAILRTEIADILGLVGGLRRDVITNTRTPLQSRPPIRATVAATLEWTRRNLIPQTGAHRIQIRFHIDEYLKSLPAQAPLNLLLELIGEALRRFRGSIQVNLYVELESEWITIRLSDTNDFLVSAILIEPLSSPRHVDPDTRIHRDTRPAICRLARALNGSVLIRRPASEPMVLEMRYLLDNSLSPRSYGCITNRST